MLLWSYNQIEITDAQNEHLRSTGGNRTDVVWCAVLDDMIPISTNSTNIIIQNSDAFSVSRVMPGKSPGVLMAWQPY